MIQRYRSLQQECVRQSKANSCSDTYFWYWTLGQPSNLHAYKLPVFQYLQWLNWSVVTVFLRGGISISPHVHQVQLQHCCYQRSFQEPYDGSHQQLHFISHCFQKVKQNVVRHGHGHFEIWTSVLQLFSSSKHPSRWWLHTFLSLHCCWMQWLPHVTTCVQRTYVVCSNKQIQWCWGKYLLRGEVKWLVVEWAGTWVEFGPSNNNFDHIIRYGGHLELQLSLYSTFQTRHILQTICKRSRNGKYIWVSETSTWRSDQSLQMLQVSLLPFFLFLRNVPVMDRASNYC